MPDRLLFFCRWRGEKQGDKRGQSELQITQGLGQDPLGEIGQNYDARACGQSDLDLGIDTDFFESTHSPNLSDSENPVKPCTETPPGGRFISPASASDVRILHRPETSPRRRHWPPTVHEDQPRSSSPRVDRVRTRYPPDDSRDVPSGRRYPA